MKSYKETFGGLDRAAMVPFFVIGDPDFDTSLELIKSAIDAGADVLELGIPFSDPVADGPTIQKADIRALEAGMDIEKARKLIALVKEYKDVPIGLLMYYNLIFQYGVDKFFVDFAAAGVNSVLVADLSVDDAEEILPAAKSAGMDTVFMVTPNTSDERMEKIVSNTTGFIYTVSVLGVTGSRDTVSTAVEPLIKKLKGKTDVPVCVGFGVSKAEHAVEIAKNGAEGVIIGSRIVKIIEENLKDKSKMIAEVKEFIANIKQALSDCGK